VRRPVQHMGPTPAPTGSTDDVAASGGRQLGLPEGVATYAAVAAASAAPQLPREPMKLTVKGFGLPKPAVYPETAPRLTSPDVSGPLSGMPVGTTATSPA
jgi:hypothetical protein